MNEIEERAWLDLCHWGGRSGRVPADKLGHYLRSVGLKLREAKLEGDLLGELDWQSEEILIEKHMARKLRPGSDLRGVKNWTVAHELAHWVLHLWAYANGLEDDQHEREADTYARGLLMPYQLLREEPAFQDLQADLIEPREVHSTVRALASRYRVSPTAMGVRLDDWGLVVVENGISYHKRLLPQKKPKREARGISRLNRALGQF